MRIGTRASALALAQARLVLERLQAGRRGDAEIVPIVTRGDRESAGVQTPRPGRGQVALGLRARGRAAARRDRRRRALRQGRPRRARRRPRARRRAAARGRRGRAVRRREPGGAGSGRARRHEQRAARGAAARRARGPRAGGDSRQRRYAPGKARAGRARRDRARARRAAAAGTRGCRSAPCSIRRASSRRPVRERSRCRRAATTRPAHEALAAIGCADSLACLLAERALARRLRRQLQHAARAPCHGRRRRPTDACARGSACPTARRGSATSCTAILPSPRRSDAGSPAGWAPSVRPRCSSTQRRWPLRRSRPARDVTWGPCVMLWSCVCT